MKVYSVKNIINELSKAEYGNASMVINMKSGASIATNPDDVSLNKDGDCMTVTGDVGTKFLDVDSIEYIEI